MHIWTLTKWEKQLPNNCRRGLRLKFDSDVNIEVHRACIEFAKWMRKEYYFPMRIPIYIKSNIAIKAMDGEMVSATFFGPYDKQQEPYIRIATGDFNDLLAERSQDDALAAIIGTIAHELTHYFQWINDLKLTLIGEERQATMYSRYIIDEYAETRDHP